MPFQNQKSFSNSSEDGLNKTRGEVSKLKISLILQNIRKIGEFFANCFISINAFKNIVFRDILNLVNVTYIISIFPAISYSISFYFILFYFILDCYCNIC